MKKLMVLTLLSVIVTGCTAPQPISKHTSLAQLAYHNRQEREGTKIEFQRKRRQLQAAWKEEMAVARRDFDAGLISGAALADREYTVNHRWSDQLYDLRHRTEERLYVIKQQHHAKYVAWLQRK